MAISQKAIILNGTKRATEIKQELAKTISLLDTQPNLAAILVGDDQASALYVKLKEKACQETGIGFHKYLSTPDCYPDITESELLELIKFLNNDKSIHGILLQLPLPPQFDTDKIIATIDPKKDVDAFISDKNKITPPTIAAIIELLKMTGENLKDKKTLIIGKSDIFLKKIQTYLKENLEIADISSSNTIPNDSAQYDIIVIALGAAHTLKKSMVKTGAIIIDVGINTLDGKTVGDVDPEVTEIAAYISPVPGGVGPLTVACLLQNTYLLSQSQ